MMFSSHVGFLKVFFFLKLCFCSSELKSFTTTYIHVHNHIQFCLFKCVDCLLKCDVSLHHGLLLCVVSSARSV